jgi:glycosyltransferase involved in cell wall biosynthesis
MTGHPTISAIVPVHNEAGFIESAVPSLLTSIERAAVPFEIILAENGSTDATAAIVDEFALGDDRIGALHLSTADYGAAMRAGFMAARGEWVANFDIDYYSGEFLAGALGEGADVVLASKRASGSDDRRSAYRRLGTWGFNVVLRVLFRSAVTDTHGMKLVRRSVVDALVPLIVSNQDLFDTELVLRAERAGYEIVEIPATVEELRATRTSFVRRIPRTLVGLWRIRRAMAREPR